MFDNNKKSTVLNGAISQKKINEIHELANFAEHILCSGADSS